MEKIKASEVLNRFAYWAVDEDGDVRIHSRMPSIVGDSWVVEDFNPRLDSVCSIDELTVPIINWKKSLREIDFSEDFTEERLSLINTTRYYLLREIEKLSMSEFTKTQQNSLSRLLGIIRKRHGLRWFISESMLGDTEIDQKENAESPNEDLIFTDKYGILNDDFPKESNLSPHPLMATDEELGKHMSKFIGTQNKSIFQEGDTVHVLSYSNQGELGISTQGVVKAIKSNSFIVVEIVNGIEEVHEEKNISFTPFSIHEAGFSQVRPEREIKEGDWGFFYDDNKWFVYGQLHMIDVNIGTYTLYHHESGYEYNYFSHTPPQLAEGIPNPFDKCQKPS